MYHTIIIVGNLGRDPEMRFTPNGQAVTHLNVASSRQYTRSDGQTERETTWFRVTVWGKQAETCNQFLKKGRSVLVEGRLNPDPVTGGPRIFSRSDGTPGAVYEVTATTVRFIGARREEETGFPSEEASIGEVSPEGEQDIPF